MEQSFINIKQIISGLLTDYETEIKEAFEKMGELSISLPVKNRQSPKGNEVIVGISFFTGKVKEDVKIVVDENQLKLPGMDDT